MRTWWGVTGRRLKHLRTIYADMVGGGGSLLSISPVLFQKIMRTKGGVPLYHYGGTSLPTFCVLLYNQYANEES